MVGLHSSSGFRHTSREAAATPLTRAVAVWLVWFSRSGDALAIECSNDWQTNLEIVNTHFSGRVCVTTSQCFAFRTNLKIESTAVATLAALANALCMLSQPSEPDSQEKLHLSAPLASNHYCCADRLAQQARCG